MYPFAQAGGKLPSLKEPSVRASVRAHFPSVLVTALLLMILIVCSTFGSVVHGCYKQQLSSRQQDLLLSSAEINVLLNLPTADDDDDNDDNVGVLRSAVRFIYVKYGRFIRTQLNAEIFVNTFQFVDEGRLAEELVDQLEQLSERPLTAHIGYRNSCSTLQEDVLRIPKVDDAKKLVLHLVDVATMTCAAQTLRLASVPTVGIMVENSPASLDIASIHEVASYHRQHV